jgi:hypothetical protein
MWYTELGDCLHVPAVKTPPTMVSVIPPALAGVFRFKRSAREKTGNTDYGLLFYLCGGELTCLKKPCISV